MMKPIWLFDFVEKGSLDSFFSTYHNALLQGDAEMSPARWFYVTEGLAEDMSIEVVEETSMGILTDRIIDGEPSEKLIPAWNNITNSSLKVVFVGDITNKHTQKYLLDSAKFVIEHKEYLPANGGIHFYALLWRPSSAVVQPGLDNESLSFVRQLDEMMSRDINNRFHKVLFFESSVLPKEKAKAFDSMKLAALHIASHKKHGDDDLLLSDSSKYFNAGAAAVFHEKHVQHEQFTQALSEYLLKLLKTGGENNEFVDGREADTFIEQQESFLEQFTPESIAQTIKFECESVRSERQSYYVDREVSPFSLKFKKVWKKYYNDYIVNLKANLVNKTKKLLSEFVSGYKEVLHRSQTNFVNEIQGKIDDRVFTIFKDPDSYKALSIPQALLVLEKIRTRIKSYANQLQDEEIKSFVFPKFLENARKQVEAEIQNDDPNNVLAVLEAKLKRHPVFLLSMFVRALVFGAMLSFASTLVFQETSLMVSLVIGTAVFILPLLISVWNFREHVVRIEALKDQYVACMLLKYQKELDAEVKRCVGKTYADLDKYCEWLKEHKLELLRDKMFAIQAPRFSFTPSARFQPLLKYVSREELLLVPNQNAQSAPNALEYSGSFGVDPILNFPEMDRVVVDGESYTLDAIMQNSDRMYDIRLNLLRGMLKSQANAIGNVQQSVRFENVQRIATKLLLLDVSGSMTASDMVELKKAVNALSRTAAIRWIAFNDKVVADGDSAEEFEKIQSGGGTNYIPALERAKMIIDQEDIDQVILISDGMPFEPIENIVKEAFTLNMPIHTISIGNDGAAVMKTVSDQTSGEQIIVDKLEELSIDVESKFNVIFTIGESGRYNLAQLMQKVYLPGCATAIYDFASSMITSGEASIRDLLQQYANERGMKEWMRAANISCTMNSAIANSNYKTVWGVQLACNNASDVVEKIVQENIEGNTNQVVIEDMDAIPDIMVSVMTLLQVDLITDITWVNLRDNN